LKEMTIHELKKFALQIRIETVKELSSLGFGHIGGSMSTIEALAVLYGAALNVQPNNPRWVERDFLVCSKGHSGPSLYAALALKGFFPIEWLETLNRPGTRLPSHCDMNKTPGIDMSTGSLGQGISTGIGIALGNKLDGRSSTTYIILGDGECQEGQIWEGALFAAHHKLDNLIVLIDNNKVQLDGRTCDVNNLEDFEEKFRSFGWYTQRVDGHDVESIYHGINMAKNEKGRPAIIVMDTIKGFGCTFTDGKFCHHMVIGKQDAQETIDALNNQMMALDNNTEGRGDGVEYHSL